MVWLPPFLHHQERRILKIIYLYCHEILDIISMFSLIILVGILSFWRIKSLINLSFNTLLCHSTKRKIRFIRFMFHYSYDTWVLFEFFNYFFQGSWICSTVANRSSLHCKPSDGKIFAKNLLNVSATRLLSDTILVLSPVSVTLFLTLFLSENNGSTVSQQFAKNVYYRQSFLYLGYWKRISFLCDKEIQNNFFVYCKLFCLHRF